MSSVRPRKSSSFTKTLGLIAIETKTPRKTSTATSIAKSKSSRLLFPSSSESPSKNSDLLEKVIELRKSRKHVSSFGSVDAFHNTETPKAIRIALASSIVLSRDPATARHYPASIQVPEEGGIDQPEGVEIRSESFRQGSDKKSLIAFEDETGRKTFKSLWHARTTAQQSPIGTPLNNPYLDRPVELEDIFKAAKEVGAEAKSIATQEYDERLKSCMKDISVKEFIEIQKLRMNNVGTIIEKIFVPKGSKDSKINLKLWNMVSMELHNVKTMYENFLLLLDDSLYKVSTGKEKIAHHVDVWKALGLVLEYNESHRAIKDSGRPIKEDKDLSKLQRDIKRFKLDFRMRKSFNPLVMEMFESVEKRIAQLDQLVDDERDRYMTLMNQHKKVMKNFQELEGRTDNIKGDFMKIIQEWKESTAFKNEMGFLNSHQRHLENRINELQEENSRVQAQQDRWKLKLIKSEEKIVELRALAFKKGNNTPQDKMVMANFYMPDLQGERLPSLSSYFIQTDLFSNGSVLQLDLAFTMMNVIYADKIISDLGDDYERRPRKSLAEFMPQWFLKKFGLYTYCESLLQDFLYTIHYEGMPQSRIRLFQALLGTQKLKDYEYTGIISKGYISNELDQQKLKRECFRTAETLKRFYKIVNSVKFPVVTTLASQTNAAPQFSNYGPFLPVLEDDEDLIDLDLAKQVLHMIMREEHFSESEAKISEDHFNLMQQHNLYERIMDDSSKAKEMKVAPKEVNKRNKCVKMDLFIKVVLDLIVDKDIKILEKSHTLLRANMSGRADKNITFDEFCTVMAKIYPSATHTWKERAFAKFINIGSGDQVPLNVLMLNFAYNYYREDEVKESYYKMRMKKEPLITVESVPSPYQKDPNKSITNSPTLSPQRQTQARMAISSIESVKTSGGISPGLIPQRQPQGHMSIPGIESAKTLGKIKEAFSLGHPALDDTAYEIYDTVSSLVLLQEIYEMNKQSFEKLEKKNEIFMRMHYEIDNALSTLLRSVRFVVTPESLVAFDKKELVCYLEHLWMKFRQILAFSHRIK